MSVLVVSILLIALAPVITKRQKDSLYIQFDKKNWEYSYLTFQNVLNADGISQCKDEEYETSDPDDSSIKYSFVVKHCKFNIPSYVKDLNAVLVSSGGGGAGSSLVNKTGYKVTKIGENLPQSLNKTTNARQTLSSNEIEITNNMTDVTVSYITGSGGGGGGAAWNYSLATSSSTPPAPQSQADCDSAAGAGISYYYNNLCITKKNIGDLMSVDELVASGIEVVTMVVTSRWAGSKRFFYGSIPNTTSIYCVNGKTGKTNTCTDYYMSNGSKIAVNYGGCNRTLCNYIATKNACSNYAPTAKTKGYWRLPTKVEVSNWVSGFDLISKFLGDNGLNFCDYGTTAGNGLVNCNGQNADDAYGSVITYADLVYTSTYTSSCPGYVVFSVNNGTPKNSSCTSSSSPYPASGRCVLDKIPSNPYRFSTFAGGGGAGAPYAKNLSIPNDLIQANIGGKIILTTNKGGAGAEAISNAKISQNSSQSGKSGSNGEYSQILIVDKNGNTVWGVKILGGKGGGAASATTTSGSYGSGASSRSSSSSADFCMEYNSSAAVNNWETKPCNAISTGTSSLGVAGKNGAKLLNSSTISPSVSSTKGGEGGGSYYNSTTATGGASGGNYTSINGENATIAGAGGGGSSVQFVPDNAEAPTYYDITQGKGGDGAPGLIELEYTLVTPAAAGGGGAGGTLAKIENIQIPSGLNEIDVFIGTGGAGGAEDRNGNIGGFTSIKVNNKTYTVYGGNPGKVGFLNNVDDYIELIHGMGGLYDKVNSEIENIKGKVSPETKSSISYGINGTSGFNILDSAGNIIGSAGGVGGISGTGSNGGCGGMLSNSICLDKTDLCRKPENNQMCLLSNVANCTLAQVCNNVTSKDGISMMPPEAYPLNLINDSGFGLAGSGGGGGGWSLQGGYETLGKGGSGQDGYIFLYWQANLAN